MPRHEMQRQIGLTGEFELQRALNKPYAYEIGPREERAIRKELGWRQQERMIAAQTQQDRLMDAGFDNGFSVDLSQGLPDPVVNHVDDVTFGKFRPKKIDPYLRMW